MTREELDQALLDAAVPLRIIVDSGQISLLHPLLQKQVRQGVASMEKLIRMAAAASKPRTLQ